MKRNPVNLVLGVLLSITLLFSVAPLTAWAGTISSTFVEFTVGKNVYSLNGVDYSMDATPYISAGRTFVPVRYLVNALGGTTGWDASTQTITVTQGSKVLTLKIGLTIERINGTAYIMDVAPVVVNGRTMLPARWVAQALGYQVWWNAKGQIVYITTPPAQNSTVVSKTMPELSYGSSVQGTHKEYSWKYNNVKYSWDVEIPNDLLSYDNKTYNWVHTFYNSNGQTQQQMMRASSPEISALILEESADSPQGKFSAWVDDPSNNSYIKNIATSLSEQAHLDGYDYFHTAEFAQSFVGGAVPYLLSDPVVPRLAAQTLASSGDCKGKSILLASILKDMGYKVALFNFSPVNSSDMYHEAVGIYFKRSQITTLRSMYEYACSNGLVYYYVESTSPGCRIGDDPHTYTTYTGVAAKSISFDRAYIYPLN